MLLINTILPGISSSGSSPNSAISHYSEDPFVFRVGDQDLDANHFVYLFTYLGPRMSFNTPDGQDYECLYTYA